MMHKKVETFSHNLKFLMKIRKLSQTQLALDTGINRGTVRAILNGKTDPRLAWLETICDTYSVNYKWLTERKAYGQDYGSITNHHIGAGYGAERE